MTQDQDNSPLGGMEGAEARWKEWYQDRPQIIQDLAKRFKPWKTYRMKETGQSCRPLSFNENGTVTCHCWHDDMPFSDVEVFGINPDNVEEIE